MKKVVGAILIGLVIVPWPWLGAPLLAPHLRGVLPPEQIEFMAPIILAYSVYLLIGLMALITLVTVAARNKKRPRAQAERMVTSGHGSPAPPMDADRRKREKRRKRARAGGDIAMALLLMDNNKKK